MFATLAAGISTALLIRCLFAGLLGGFLKSAIEHKGKLKLPLFEEDEETGQKFFVMGFLFDMVGGVAAGWITTVQWVVESFSLSSPNPAFSFFMGVAWLVLIQKGLEILGFSMKLLKGGGSKQGVDTNMNKKTRGTGRSLKKKAKSCFVKKNGVILSPFLYSCNYLGD